MSSEKSPAPYIRRRAYSKIHVTSWCIYLEKDGFVRCSFKNCNFMAFDVEEMCNHYGFCTGVNSKFKYVCEHCKGCTDDKKKLDLHLARAHNVIKPVSDTESEPESPERTEKSKPSRVLMQSWTYFFEQYNYIKCSVCDYLANTLSEMCRHYTVCKVEKDLLLYVCSECKGRTMSVNPLLWHLERSHKIFRAPNQFNHITKSMVRYWERELDGKGYASCLHITKGQRDCFYFDLKILGIVEHSQCCKGPNCATVKEQCPHCRMWTSTTEMLQFHIDSDYHSNEDTDSSASISISKSLKNKAKDQSSSVSKGSHCPTISKSPNKKNEDHLFTVIESDKRPDKNIEISIVDEVNRQTSKPGDIFLVQKEETKKSVAGEKGRNELKINTVYTWKNLTKSNNSDHGNIYIALPQHSETIEVSPMKTKRNQCDTIQSLQNNPVSSKKLTCDKQNKQSHRNVEEIELETNKVVSETDNTSLGYKNIEETVENKTAPTYQNKKITKQKQITSQNEQYKSEVKKFEGHALENEIITVDQIQDDYAAEHIINKEKLDEDSGMVIDIEEGCLQTTNNYMGNDTVNNPQQCSIINNPGSKKETCNKEAEKPDATSVRKLSLSTTTQGNKISINILNDWKESDDSDCDDDTLQTDYSNKEEKINEDISIQGNFSNVKLLHEVEENLKGPQKEKLRKAQTKQPCLFEDELLSDDGDDDSFSRDESIETEVKMDLSFDNKQECENRKVSPKNYLKRQSIDSVRPSCSKRPSTYVKLNVGSEIVKDAAKTSENKPKEETCEQEIFSNLDRKKDKSIKDIVLKSDAKVCPENFANSNDNKVTDEASKNSEKNDKLMLDKAIISIEKSSTAIPSTAVEHNQPIITEEKTENINYDVSKTNHIDLIESRCDDGIMEKQLLEKLPDGLKHDTSNDITSQPILTNKTLVSPKCNVQETSILSISCNDLNKEELMGEEERASDSSGFLVSFISKGKLNKSHFEDYIQREEVDEQNTSNLESTKASDEIESETLDCCSQNNYILYNNSNYLENNESCNDAHGAARLFDECKVELINDDKFSDTSRRISSEWSDDSCTDGDFLGTDEELDMKDCNFNGFQEISEESWSHRRDFHRFLNRLSESETEEWYINAGSLSMEIKKEEKLLCRKSYTKKHLQSIKIKNQIQPEEYIITNTSSQSNISRTLPTAEHSIPKLEGLTCKVPDRFLNKCAKRQNIPQIDVEKPLVNGDTLKAEYMPKPLNISFNNNDGIKLVNSESKSTKEHEDKSSINNNNPLLDSSPIDINNRQQLTKGATEVYQDISKELDFENKPDKSQDDALICNIVGKTSNSEFTPKMSSTPIQTTLKTSEKGTNENHKLKAVKLFHNVLQTDTMKTSSTSEKDSNLTTKETLSNNTNSDKPTTGTFSNNHNINIYNLATNSDNFFTKLEESKPQSNNNNSSNPLTKRKRGRPPKKIVSETSDMLADISKEEGNFNSNTVKNTVEPFQNIKGLSSDSEDEFLVSIYSEKAFDLFQNNNKIPNTGYVSFLSVDHELSSSLSDTSIRNVTLSTSNSSIPKRRGRPPGSKTKLKNSINSQNKEKPKWNDSSPKVKSDIQNSTPTNENTSKIEKKKRGRPPKSVRDQNSSFLSESTNDSKINDTINDISIGSENELSEVTENLDCKLKAETDQSLSDGLSVLSNVEGDSKVKDEYKTDNDSTCSMVKKKRGRPPKIKTDLSLSGEVSQRCNDESRTKVLVECAHLVIKKKRGRPPKLKTDHSLSIVPDPDNRQSQKHNSCEITNEENELLPQVKKKRGRPPNSTNLNQLSSALASPPSKRKRFKNKYIYDDYQTEDSKGNEVDSSHSSNQLLGTDVILINEHKLSQSSESDLKRPSRNLKNDTLNLEEGADDSDDSIDSDYKQSKRNKSLKPSLNKSVDNEGNRPERRTVESSIFPAKHKATDQVKCGVCKESMTYQKYKEHAMHKHYMLCWLDEEEPSLDMNNEKEILSRLWYTKKRVRKILFRCSNCNLPKLSAVGFLSHIKFCGTNSEERESLLWTCHLCGARMMPSSKQPHLYIKHNSGTGTERSSALDQTLVIPKTKRAAANRAVESIQNHVEESKGETEEDRQSRPLSPTSKATLSRLYTKPNRSINIELYRRIQATIQEQSYVTCQHKGCDYKVYNTVAFRKHYVSCPIGPPREYKCRPCSFTSTTEREMQEHVMAEHQLLIHTQHSDNSEKSDNSDGESKPSSYNPSLYFKFLQQPRGKFRGHPRKLFFTDALRWTLKLRENKLASEVLFSEAQVSTSEWQHLTPELATSYLPALQNSMQFCGKDKTWRKLRRFEGTFVDGVPMIFAGGPVWASAWAPVPDSGGHQFLAVSTHPNMKVTHEMATVYNYKSLIQIWCFGHLNNIEPDSGETPKFLLGLAHNRGAVWALRWCPAGCHDDTRLGLLAAACSDGTIPIYCVPRYRYTFEFQIYDVKPVWKLKLGCEMLTQCVNIDWHSVKPHKIIAGGFANGMVALWDLTTSSSLLKDGNTIYPFKVIEAHLSAVTAVCISPTDEGMYLMTASLDRATKFWRLEDTTAPVNTLRKASVMDAVMPSNWLTSICGFDDVYSLNSLHVSGYNYRETYTVGNINYVLQPGTIWSISFNDWLNACACASELGKVTVFFRKQILVTEDSKKVKNNSLVGDIVTYSVQPLDSSKDVKDIGKNYSDCVSKVGLDINFMEEVTETIRPSSACSSDCMDQYPILSVNKVAWNPNYTSFMWLAVGMQCGLVMAPRVKCVPSKDIADLYMPER